MKKIIGIGIVAMMVMGIAGAAMAAPDTGWVINVKVSDQANFSLNAKTSVFKTSTTASVTDYQDANDTLAPPTGAGSLAYAYSMNTQADGVTVKNMLTDVRKSLTVANPLIQFKFKLGLYNFGGDSQPAIPNGLYIRVFNLANAGAVTTNSFVPNSVDETIKLYQIVGGQKQWLFDITGPGADSASDVKTYNSAMVSLDSEFLLEASAVPQSTVPEPGSMVAMMSGLVGLAGFAIRRRK